MTVIATDGKTIAADGLMTFGYERGANQSEKLSTSHGVVFATAGVAIHRTIVNWYAAGADPNNLPRIDGAEKWYLLVIDSEGMRFFSSLIPYPTRTKSPFTMGQGGEYAMGALQHGATPEEAVAIAIKMCTGCGGEIQVIDIAEALGLDKPLLEAAE